MTITPRATVAVTQEALDEDPDVLLIAVDRIGGWPVLIQPCTVSSHSEYKDGETCALHITSVDVLP